MTRLLLALACTATLSAQSFQAGYARRDITPREPVPMWGYGSRHDALSQGTLDPLYADAVVIQAGDTKLAIVELDLGRSPSDASLDRIRERVKKDTGIVQSFIAGSHTHHGPVLELTDRERRGKNRFDAAIRYYAQMEESIAVGSVAITGFNVNRHTKLTPKPSDRDLAVLRLDTADGRPIALIVNFAAHPTTLPDTTMQFSADFVGAMKNAVSAELKTPVVFMQGAAGDQSVNREKGGYTEYGRALAAKVIRVSRDLQPQDVPAPVLALKDERFQFPARIDLSNPLILQMYGKAFFPDEYTGGVRPRLSVALLNKEIAFIAASGESFSNHAIRLKERARVKTLFFFFGYCANATVSPIAPGAGEQLMNTALLWIYQLKWDRPPGLSSQPLGGLTAPAASPPHAAARQSRKPSQTGPTLYASRDPATAWPP